MKMEAYKVTSAIGTAVLALAVIFHCIAMSTSYFLCLSDTETREAYAELGYEKTLEPLPNSTVGLTMGLWQLCVDSPLHNDTECGRIDMLDRKDWLSACQTLAIVGMLLVLGGCFFFLAWILTPLTIMPQCLLIATIVLCVLGGLLILSGDILFGSRGSIDFYAESVNWKDKFFFNPATSNATRDHEITVYDKHLRHDWGIVLDLISGSLSILAGVSYICLLYFVTDRGGLPGRLPGGKKKQKHKKYGMHENRPEFVESKM